MHSPCAEDWFLLGGPIALLPGDALHLRYKIKMLIAAEHRHGMLASQSSDPKRHCLGWGVLRASVRREWMRTRCGPLIHMQDEFLQPFLIPQANPRLGYPVSVLPKRNQRDRLLTCFCEDRLQVRVAVGNGG